MNLLLLLLYGIFLQLSADTKAQDFPTYTVAPNPQLQEAEQTAGSALQLFSDGKFDLGQKQVTCRPGKGGAYTISTGTLGDLISLEQDWLEVDDILFAAIETGFLFGGGEQTAAYISKAGYISFNETIGSGLIDCKAESSYSTEDIIVALCTPDLAYSLVRYAQLDDRLVVQWALPSSPCMPPSPASAPAGAPTPSAAKWVTTQAELLPDGTFTLAWTVASPCQTAVGFGVAGVRPTILAFSQLPAPREPLNVDCTTFSVTGLGEAYSCSTRLAVVLPASLQPVVLMAGTELVQQQVVTVVNAAGQGIAETGTLPSTAVAPTPAGLVDTSTAVRRLHQAFPGGGFGLLQNLESILQTEILSQAPKLVAEIAAAKASMQPPIIPAHQPPMGPAYDMPMPAPSEQPLAPRQLFSKSPLSHQRAGVGPNLGTHMLPPASLYGIPTPVMQPATALSSYPVVSSPSSSPKPGPAPAPGSTGSRRLLQFVSPSQPAMQPATGSTSAMYANPRGVTSPLLAPMSPQFAAATGPAPSITPAVTAVLMGPVSVPAVLEDIPAVAPLSVEAAASVVAAVGVQETPHAPLADEIARFVPASGCSQPRQAGPCERYSGRWFYDAAAGDCKEFAFGGCLGNLNNFPTQIICQQACIAGTIAPKEATATSGVSTPSEDELVFLTSALTPRSWITLDATSGVLPAGATAALHLTYNATGLAPGMFIQNLTVNTNDPQHMHIRLQPSMYVFCSRLPAARTAPSAPNVTFVSLSGIEPDWAVEANLTNDIAHVYLELDIIFADPVLDLTPDQLTIEAGDEHGSVVSIQELNATLGYGPMCSAWRVRAAAPLPYDYALSAEGTLLVAAVMDVQTVWGDTVPPVTANKTLYDTLPQCTLYALGMTFGGDFGLAVASNASNARAVLVCSASLQGLCPDCILPQSAANSAAALDVSFFGLVPGMVSQYDIEITWQPGEFFGAANFTVVCNATDNLGRPLAAVQPLPFAVVANPQLNPPAIIVEPPSEPKYPPGLNPYASTPGPAQH